MFIILAGGAFILTACLRGLYCPRVRARALTPHRQALAMADAGGKQPRSIRRLMFIDTRGAGRLDRELGD